MAYLPDRFQAGTRCEPYDRVLFAELLGKRKLSEMTPDEYLAVVREVETKLGI